MHDTELQTEGVHVNPGHIYPGHAHHVHRHLHLVKDLLNDRVSVCKVCETVPQPENSQDKHVIPGHEKHDYRHLHLIQEGKE